MAARAWGAGMMLLTVLLGGLEEAAGGGKGISVDEAAVAAVCPIEPAAESFLSGLRDWCPSWYSPRFGGSVADLAGVTEGEEVTLQQALSIVQKNKNDYVALLFYASWCPFSRACKPNFNALSLLFPSIRHFAFEESVIRPSILSRYGVHGFPTIFLINSTMRVRYHGSRAVASLIAFYNDVTGIPLRPLDSASLERLLRAPINGRPKDVELENCPFSWARSPERFFQEDTYLALAAAFVVCRVVYLLLPSVLGCGRRAWRRHGGVARIASLWDGSRMAFAKLSLNPCRRRDLQEGAMNAKIWASKSLVPVTMGEPSSVRRAHSGFQRT